jgi:hypothetical protein
MSDWSTGATTRRVVAGVLLAGWLLSLALPAILINMGHFPDQPVAYGWEVLRAGAIYIAAFQFGWLANPLLLILLAMLAWRTPSRRGLVITAILLALCTLDTIDLFLRPRFHSFEGAFGGYYVWVAVNLLAALAAFVFSRAPPKVAEATNTSKATTP